MEKKEKQRLVLIGISRRGEKSFKTLLRAEPKNKLSPVIQVNHLNEPAKNLADGIEPPDL